ncbi:hypothetical protein ENUP19_0057G0002 [Entamoeba nuttalli]|uniref:CXXC-rich protein n=1 Tax=Entamoeba nuttalli TaxID=412467 RepID=A0ABQ0DCU6_9EUKA
MITLILFTFIVFSFGKTSFWCNYDDNYVKYKYQKTSDCNTWGWSYSNNRKTDRFEIKNDEIGQIKKFSDIEESKTSKDMYFSFLPSSHSNYLKVLIVETKYSKKMIWIYHEHGMDGLFVGIGCFESGGCRTSLNNNYGTYIYIFDKSIIVYSKMDEKWVIDFSNRSVNNKTKTIPFIYIDGDDNQTVSCNFTTDLFSRRSYNDPQRYLFTGKIGSANYIHSSDYKFNIKSVCSRTVNNNIIQRYMAFDSSDTSTHSICDCTSQSNIISTNKSNYDFVDCSSNSTYFDLKFNQTSSTSIQFQLFEWYSIIPEPDKHYSFSIPKNKELNVQVCKFESTLVTLVEGKINCHSLSIDANVIKETSSLSVSTITTLGEINNLNQNGSIINFGTLSSVGTTINIKTDQSQSTCFELVSSNRPINIITNGGYVLEKKLLRICPSNDIDSTIVCTLKTNTITNSNTYQNVEGTIVHCPCYGLNCITKFSKEGTLIIASEYQGIIELISSTTQVIEQQYKALSSLRLKGTKNIAIITTNSKTSNQFVLNIEAGSKILVIGNEIGFSQESTNKRSTKVGSEYPCQALLFNGETSECSICKNTMIDEYCPFDNDIPKHCLKYKSLNECIQCEENYYLEDKLSTICPTNCLKCLNGVCIQCKDNYFLDNGSCLNKTDPNIQLIINNVVMKCRDSFYSIGNECSSCSTNCQYCSINDRDYKESVCSICSNSTILTSSQQCSTIPNSERTSNINAIECESKYRIVNGQCESCNQFGSLCQKCTSNQCTLCLDGIINENGICVDSTTTGCLKKKMT